MTSHLLSRVIGLLTIGGLVLVTLSSCTMVLEVGRHAMTLPLPKPAPASSQVNPYPSYTRTFLPYVTAAPKHRPMFI